MFGAVPDRRHIIAKVDNGHNQVIGVVEIQPITCLRVAMDVISGSHEKIPFRQEKDADAERHDHGVGYRAPERK